MWSIFVHNTAAFCVQKLCTCVYNKHTHLYKHRHSGISLFRMQIDFEHKIWIIQSLSYNTHQFIPYKSDKADLTWDMGVCLYVCIYPNICIRVYCVDVVRRFANFSLVAVIWQNACEQAGRQAGRLTNTV